MIHLLEGFCRSDGQGTARNLPVQFAREGTIPGAVAGSIPEEYAASRPIYFEGPVSLEQFLVQSSSVKNNLDMRSSLQPEDAFLWPSTSRFSFVSAFAFALLAALFLSATAKASEESIEVSEIVLKTDVQNVQNIRLAYNAVSKDTQPQGRVISFVCGRPNTLQVIAPIDLPEARPVRLLPQGDSPIAQMKYMPAARKTAPKSSQTKPDTASTDRVYQKLLKLSLNDQAVYQAEAQSFITYFSILTGGQDQKRTEELEKILGESPKSK